jgi:N-acetylglucosaminyldiphosphoundecaprenol N-acetyl-beta-D-mannosaminyltransferase
MPMALLEALGCGLPAAATDVGEVRRVLLPGVNGAIAAARDAEAFALALVDVLTNAAAWRGAPALAAVAPFQPADVLAPAYERYRELGRDAVSLRRSAVTSAGAAPLDRVQRERRPVVGVPIDLLDRVGVSRQLVAWAKANESRYMCFVNVHSAVHATLDERHRLVLLRADLAAPDGAPIAWTLRMKGHRSQQRVDGPGMMWRLCADAADHGVRIGLYGSTPETLEALRAELIAAFPKLVISYAHSPPFRALTEVEDQQVCEAVAAASVGLLFVGLGCPKQEYWMAQHRGRIPAVMLGVGAAFEFHAGTVSRAPHWMRENGLEWLYRLASQPRRLWRRYLFSNSLFLAKLAGEAARSVADRLRPPGA